MIQAVADDEERGALGMHYTSVPNIRKVLDPLFLDDLRQKLDDAGDGSTPASKGQLKRLRDRLARIRVFDPACGSGNFLVIAYKQMREIEAEINHRRGEADRRSEIPLTNFRGIELRHFAAEVARLALVIAEYQCDVLHRGPKLALAEFLPLDAENWITHGNALRLDWRSVCPRPARASSSAATTCSRRRSTSRRWTSRTRAARRTSAGTRLIRERRIKLNQRRTTFEISSLNTQREPERLITLPAGF